jgi:hypothetical protein
LRVDLNTKLLTLNRSLNGNGDVDGPAFAIGSLTRNQRLIFIGGTGKRSFQAAPDGRNRMLRANVSRFGRTFLVEEGRRR